MHGEDIIEDSTCMRALSTGNFPLDKLTCSLAQLSISKLGVRCGSLAAALGSASKF